MAEKKKAMPERAFEASLKRLEAIVQRLEDGAVPLEEALDLYEEGISLSKACAEELSRAEIRLKRLGRDLEGNLKLFEQEDEAEE